MQRFHSKMMTKKQASRKPPTNNVLIKILRLAIPLIVILNFALNFLLLRRLSYDEAQQLLGPAAARAIEAASAFAVDGIASPAANKKEKDDEDEGLSACLLVNDENARLPEWIAYHYHLLPLRYLTVAVDPASRSSPSAILNRWNNSDDNGIYLDVQIWNDEDYLKIKDRGPCTNDPDKCTKRHRRRQGHFMHHCMADFKARNKTWVLLTDVDEYITFNRFKDDDPEMPSEEAPEGMPTLGDWRLHYNPSPGWIDGAISGLPPEGSKDYGEDVRNGDFIKTGALVVEEKEVQPGGVVEDKFGRKYFLRDDSAYMDLTALPHAPPDVPTLKGFDDGDPYTSSWIYNDIYDGRADGELADLEMNWTYGVDTGLKMLHGGHVIRDMRGKRYYFEREQDLWPRHLTPTEGFELRWSLPSISDGQSTIMSVLAESKKKGLPLGACLTMPRLFYGSKETDHTKQSNEVVPEGFAAEDFVTLRYQYHAMKGTFDTNLHGKTIIDVSRVPMQALHSEQGAPSVHRPLIYYCRRDMPRYATSLLRVNHYLDSWEAYTYRNDARAKRNYKRKGEYAAFSMDADVRPWLKQFVRSIGENKAKMLLKNAGEFPALGNETVWQQMQKPAASPQ